MHARPPTYANQPPLCKLLLRTAHTVRTHTRRQHALSNREDETQYYDHGLFKVLASVRPWYSHE